MLWHNKTTGDTGYWLIDSNGKENGFHDYGAGDTAYSIALLSQYAAAGFATVADQGGGAVVTDTAAQGSSGDATWLTTPQH